MAGLYAIVAWLGHRSLSRAYAALEADGRPMKAEQIIPAEIPDADNAALIYESVVLRLKAEQADGENLYERLENLASDMASDKPKTETIDQFRTLTESEPVLEALASLKIASTKSGCRYDLDYTKGAGLELHHVSYMQALSRILCAKARIQASGGDAAAAWDTIITALRLANALKDEPIVISQLVRVAQFKLASDAMQDVAKAGLPSADQSREVPMLLEGFQSTAPYVAAMDGERLLFGEWAFALFGGVDRFMRENLGGGIAFYTSFPVLMQRDHAAYLNFFHVHHQNPPDLYSRAESEKYDELNNELKSSFYVLTSLVAPALSQWKARYLSMVAEARLVRVGLAALQYRQEKGAYPADLQAVDAVGILDPFSGKPFIYRADESGLVIYSVGKDWDDDGGLPIKGDSGDIVWQYVETK